MNKLCRENLVNQLLVTEINTDDKGSKIFFKICGEVLNRHAPQKKKYVRGNQSPFINKALSKEIMKRTNLRNHFLKNRTEKKSKKIHQQRNFCVSLLRKTKRNNFNSLNENNIFENRKFWKTLKPMFYNKSITNGKIILVENERVLYSDNVIADVWITSSQTLQKL